MNSVSFTQYLFMYDPLPSTLDCANSRSFKLDRSPYIFHVSHNTGEDTPQGTQKAKRARQLKQIRKVVMYPCCHKLEDIHTCP